MCGWFGSSRSSDGIPPGRKPLARPSNGRPAALGPGPQLRAEPSPNPEGCADEVLSRPCCLASRDEERSSFMFEADNIRDWRDHDVVDPEGNKIGQLEAIYVDTSTDLPVFA